MVHIPSGSFFAGTGAFQQQGKIRAAHKAVNRSIQLPRARRVKYLVLCKEIDADGPRYRASSNGKGKHKKGADAGDHGMFLLKRRESVTRKYRFSMPSG